MSPVLAGALLGLVAAVGLILVIANIPAMRKPTMSDRIAPYLRESPRPSGLLATGATPNLTGLASRLVRQLTTAIDRWVGGSASVQRRLDALEDDRTVDDIRFEQVQWAAVGLVVGLIAGGFVAVLNGGVVVASGLLLAFAGALGGVFARDWWLTRQVRRRDEALLAEFPVVADLLALAVIAGEAPQAAIDRVSRLVGGELGRSMQGALALTRSGMPLVESLERMARTSNLEVLTRFIDGLVIAMERGTPLADVLRAQAADVREHGKRQLLEKGGRNELRMMVPVVFLVLPVTVLFALFPGLFSIVQLAR